MVVGVKEDSTMAMGKRDRQRQEELWIATTEMPAPPGHPFYRKLNQLLAEHGFDGFVEGLCQKFYAEVMGRPSIPPGIYFRMLLIGYFEGIDSERGIAWRCADSRTLSEFLGYGPKERTPDHSSMSKVRQRIDLETHQEVFTWAFKVVAASGLLRGKTVGIDATTLEANAAMRSIVRKDTGQGYEEFLTDLARASGIETPTREDLAKIDKSRKNKASNDDWQSPSDPDAKITKMKDGTTHLAHKAEHAVDMETGAVVAVTLQGADVGDTDTVYGTVVEATGQMREVADDPKTAEKLDPDWMAEVVDDKGYHSGQVLVDMEEVGIRTYTSEPRRKGRRDWTGKRDERDAVYANRRRIRGERGKRLMRRRGELVERSFAHNYETGGMRRTHLRGHENILKRLLIHVGGFNLGLVMRQRFGIGKPRRLQDGLAAAIFALIWAVGIVLGGLWRRLASVRADRRSARSHLRLRPAA
jgi:transposase